MIKTYKLQPISSLLSYTIEDICNMYSMHPQTVRKWIKIGLRTIDSKKPSLIHGSDLKKFLEKHNEKLKKHLDFEEFFCVTCKEAHIPLFRKVYLEQNHQFIKAKGVCPITKKIMNRSYKLADYPQLKKNFSLEEMARLYDSSNPTLNTKIGEDNQKQKSESEFNDGELYYEQSIQCEKRTD